MTSFVFPIFLGVDKKESRQVKKQVYSPHYTDEETDMRKEMDFHSFISFFIHQLFTESHEVLGSHLDAMVIVTVLVPLLMEFLVLQIAVFKMQV